MAHAFDLVCTLGPSSFGKERELVEAGATALRINTSHLAPEQTRDAVLAAQRSAPAAAIVLDLQGAKMRTGRTLPRMLTMDERIGFSLDGSGDTVPVPHPELFGSLGPGDTLSLDDDRLRFRVVEVDAQRIEAVTLAAGILRPRRGVNVLEHPIVLEDLPGNDLRTLELAQGVSGLEIAVSFVADGREIEWVRRRRTGGRVTAKIERREAVHHLSTLAERADALWICRGDLGAQIGLVELARFVARLDPRRLGLPVLMAGQVFEHLTHHDAPTRSEVCHFADLIERGYVGIVLSDETAIGRDPIAAVRQVAALAEGLGA